MKIETTDEFVEQCPECGSVDFELDYQRIPPGPNDEGGSRHGYCHDCKRYLQVDPRDIRKEVL
jgi:RNA polymerase subunit RPABC4/transcription elongation factor Spt4